MFKKRNSARRARVLTFERLENRELLSVTPELASVVASAFESANPALIAPARLESTSCEPIQFALPDETDALELSNAVVVAARTLPQPEVRAYATGTRWIDFSWNAIADAAGYRIRYRQAGDPEATCIDLDSTTTSYKLENLTPGATYYVNMVALGDGVETLDSPAVKYKTITTKPLVALTQPKVRSYSVGTRQIDFAWNAINGAEGYRIRYRQAGAPEAICVEVDATTTGYNLANLTPGAVYCVNIVALGDGVETLDSAAVKYKTITTKAVAPLAQPEVRSYSVGTRQIDFTWNAINGAVGYRIRYRQSGDPEATCIEVDANATNYKLENLTPGAVYCVNIVALGDGVDAWDSAAVKYKTITTKPLAVLAQPTVSATATGTRWMEFSWNGIAGATGYRLVYCQSTSVNQKTTIELDPNTTSYRLENLEPGGTFYVNVASIGDGIGTKDSGTSKYATIKTKPLTALVQPNILNYAVDTRWIDFSWNAIAGASGYRIAYCPSTAINQMTTIVVGSNTTGYRIENLNPNGTYYVNVVAIGDGVETKDSGANKYSTIKTKPLVTLAQPVITSYQTTDASLTINWNAISDAANYAIFYKESSVQTATTVLVDPTSTRHTITGLVPGATYYLRLVALGDGVKTADSPSSAVSTITLSATPKAASPAILDATSTAFTISVDWEAVKNCARYEVVYNLVGSKLTKTVKVDAKKTSCVIEGVRPSESYEIKVRAIGKTGYANSDYCQTRTVTTLNYVPIDGAHGLSGDAINVASAISAIPAAYKKAAEKQGKIVQFDYAVGNGQKSANVYLPPGYTAQKRYDVVYLMHGYQQNANTIMGAAGASGDFKNALDHLISGGVIEPIIVVMPTFYGSSKLSGGPDGVFYDVAAFTRELAEDLIPQLEAKYSTYAESTDPEGLANSRAHRAYGGFSLGSVSTWDVLCDNIAYFGAFLPISADLVASHWNTSRPYAVPSTRKMVETLAASVRAQGFTKKDFLVYSFTGSSDYAYQSQTSMVNMMKGETDVFGGNLFYRVKSGGSHTIPYLQEYLYNAFKDLYRV
ncbi:MAG: fibronectin type III domain-containing protein [Thermoguttaceae bacterium]|nr:fibronectin type III domain-containing protein [Thermoguttaceae bacterium]